MFLPLLEEATSYFASEPSLPKVATEGGRLKWLFTAGHSRGGAVAALLQSGEGLAASGTLTVTHVTGGWAYPPLPQYLSRALGGKLCRVARPCRPDV